MVLLQHLHLDGVRTWHGRGRGYEAGPEGRGLASVLAVRGPPPFAPRRTSQ